MTEPTVCCVMLTKDRAAMAARAVRSFRAQTYSNKELLIFDSGDPSWYGQAFEHRDEYHLGADAHDGKTIGALRNIANSCMSSDIIAHFDSDDYSHPSRIQEQVALLQASGADCVGYNEMLFHSINRQAWLYHNPSRSYALGTSLCYWRKSWEKFPFDDAPRPDKLSFDGSMLSEYRTFLNGVKLVSVSANNEPVNYFDNCPMVDSAGGVSFTPAKEPRMIASLHGGNTSSKITSGPEWRRAPEWDAYCERTMKL